jgi:hypothetical protein
MTIKTMTPQQIRDDLDALALTWPEGIPSEQTDRVNALRGELKRRGEDPWVAGAAKTPMASMDADELEMELRELSARIARNPNDEPSQKRFADVRYELRRRTKGSDDSSPKTTPLPPRVLEFDDDVPMKQLKKRPEERVERVANFSTPTQEESAILNRKAVKRRPGVASFSVATDGDFVVLELSLGPTIDLVSRLSIDEANALIAMMRSARDEAAAVSRTR